MPAAIHRVGSGLGHSVLTNHCCHARAQVVERRAALQQELGTKIPKAASGMLSDSSMGAPPAGFEWAAGVF